MAIRRPSIRRTVGATALASALAAVAVIFAACGIGTNTERLVGSPARPPNVVLFLTDDQRHDLMEFMPIVQRELVQRGVRFDNAYATTPICCPSRASILTGLYAHTHGVIANAGHRGGWRGFKDESTLATWLRGSGARTMLVGKYLNLYHSKVVPPGWSDWYAIWDSGKKYYDYTVNNNGETRFYGDKERWYSTDVLTRQAVRLLESQTEAPFFLYMSYDGPHSPPEPAKQDRGSFANLPPLRLPSYDEEDVSDKPTWVRELPRIDQRLQAQIDEFRRNQVEVLQSIDRSIGTIVETLRKDGRLDNTWLIFMSDNGLSLGEHRYGMHKSCGYEECVRLPLVVVPPAALAGGFAVPRAEPGIALNIDLAPTVADMMNVETGHAVEGQSLLPLLRNPDLPWQREALLELWPNDEDMAFRGLRFDRWKYLRYGNGEEELYDLGTDPYELENLAARPGYAELLRDFGARVEALYRPVEGVDR